MGSTMQATDIESFSAIVTVSAPAKLSKPAKHIPVVPASAFAAASDPERQVTAEPSKSDSMFDSWLLSRECAVLEERAEKLLQEGCLMPHDIDYINSKIPDLHKKLFWDRLLIYFET